MTSNPGRDPLLEGMTQAHEGDASKAIDLLEPLGRQLQPSFEALYWLSVAYRRFGNKSKAVASAKRAAKLRPQDASAQVQLGLSLLDARLLPEAEACLRTGLRLHPGNLQLACFLAQSLNLQGKNEEASTVIDSALDKDEVSLAELERIGFQLLAEENWLAAEKFGRRMITVDFTCARGHLLVGRALMEQGASGEGLNELRIARELDPNSVETLNASCAALQASGRKDEAQAQAALSIQIEKSQGYPYFASFYMRKVVDVDDAQISKMTSLLESESNPALQRSYLEYGLGKAYEDLGKFDLAMVYYDAANRTECARKFGDRVFDAERFVARTERMIQTFDEKAIYEHSGAGSTTRLPIFVIGMMRSGTTLAEQILSSHPEVGSGGEQTFWADNWRQLVDPDGTRVLPECFKDLSERYCSTLKRVAPERNHVVDKLPGNTYGLGAIHLSLPRAKIIHMKRHAVDTCLSIYATPNRARNEFSHRRKSLVVAYQEYTRLMDHWHAVLPAGSIFEVEYEQLVEDPERVTRAMIAFCEIEWSDLCLRPERNERVVKTPSVWQVRQPIYRTSVARWRNFEPWLGEFSSLLLPTT
jgi:tetratricopeptide (TPR) repeat protein